MKRHVQLERGKVYQNENGSLFRCDDVLSDGAVMVNVRSGWRCTAHVITMYENGTIEWDYSTGGSFIN